MTTQTMTIGGIGTKPTLEELVDRLITAMFGSEESAPSSTRGSVARSVHEARRLRQAGDLDEALAVMASADMTAATDGEARWAYAEWLDLAGRRFGDGDMLVYSPAMGSAAVLAPAADDDGTLVVAAVLGMRWAPGKRVSRRSLRGLRRPVKGGAR